MSAPQRENHVRARPVQSEPASSHALDRTLPPALDSFLASTDPDFYFRKARVVAGSRSYFRGRFSEEELREFAQEAYAATYLKARGDDPPRRAEGYFVSVVYNRLLDALRSRERHPTESLDCEGRRHAVASRIPAADPSPLDCAERAHQADLVEEVLRSLPESSWLTLIKLRLGWDFEPAEITRRLGMTPKRYEKEIAAARKAVFARVEVMLDGRWCAELRSVVTAYAHGLASRERSELVELHLRRCAPCRERVAQLRTEHAAAAGRIDRHQRDDLSP